MVTSGNMPMESTCNGEGSDARDIDSTSCESVILDEMDSYLSEINTRLTISRMVTDSVIKGMVNAVVEEADERINLKEAELAILSGRLKHYESGLAKDGILDPVVVVPEPLLIPNSQETKPSHHLPLGLEENHVRHLEKSRTAAEEKLQRLKEEITSIGNIISLGGVDACSADVIDAFKVLLSATYEQISGITCSSKDSESERQWEQEFQREVDAAIVQSRNKELQDELETKLCEQRGLVTTANKKWQEKIGELSTMRQDMDAIYRCLFNFEPGLLISHNSTGSLGERNAAKRRDHLTLRVSGNQHLPCASHADEKSSAMVVKPEDSVKSVLNDSPQLLNMKQEDMIMYFKAEMAKMKRQHDLALEEKTEDLFILKREFLKEKGSIPSHFRKDKECELLMRRIPEFLSKLDGILLDNEKVPFFPDDHAILDYLKDRIDFLFFENQWLRGLLRDKTKEATCFASQVVGAENQISHYSSLEAIFSEQTDKLQSDMEDAKIVTTIRDEVNKKVLIGLVGELKSDMECVEMFTKTEHDICFMIYREAIRDARSISNPIMEKYYKDMNSVEARFLEKDKALHAEIEENMRLKQEVMSLLISLKEKEKAASEAGRALMQQTERLGLLFQEHNILSARVNEQEMHISESNRDSDLMKGRFDEALQQIHQYEVKMSEVNHKITTLSDALEEGEKQKTILHGDLQEKQKALASAITKENELKKWMETIVCSMKMLSKDIVDCEGKFSDHVKVNESRLKFIKHHCVQLVQEANILKRKELWYKQGYERRCSDLQKAEIEVDLLGDEVDGLLSLLEQIYVALDHYSEVLQHYPGVIEILRTIRKEMKKKKDQKFV